MALEHRSRRSCEEDMLRVYAVTYQAYIGGSILR
jgi:hypothetical protein